MSEHLVLLLRNRAKSCAKSGANGLAELNSCAADEIEQLQATNHQLVEALEGLVNTKQYKDRYGKDREYSKMRVAAWSKAQQAITNAKQLRQQADKG